MNARTGRPQRGSPLRRWQRHRAAASRFSVVILALVLCDVPFGLPSHRRQISAQSQPQRQGPVFRSDVGIVEVDASVTDGEGRVVRGLTAEDFEILEDGRPQKIAAFSFVDLPIARPEPAAEPADAPPPDVTSNSRVARDGRIFVVLMDSPSTGGPPGGSCDASTRTVSPSACLSRRGAAYDLFARRFASQFVQEAVAPGDVVAVVHAQGTFGDSQAFTTSKPLALSAIERHGRGVSGADGWSELTGPERVTRNMNTYRAVADLSERLGAMSGRRKAIIWVGGQVAQHPETIPCVPASDPMNFCAISRGASILLAAYRDAIGAATRNNVASTRSIPRG